MRKFIKNKLVELHKNCTTDEYGQVGSFNFTPSVFGDQKDEVKQYCQDNEGILQFATYGASYGTYTALYGTYTAFTIVDKEISRECSKALSTNPNYIRI